MRGAPACRRCGCTGRAAGPASPTAPAPSRTAARCRPGLSLLAWALSAPMAPSAAAVPLPQRAVPPPAGACITAEAQHRYLGMTGAGSCPALSMVGRSLEPRLPSLTKVLPRQVPESFVVGVHDRRASTHPHSWPMVTRNSDCARQGSCMSRNASRTASLRMARRATSPRYMPDTIFSKRCAPALGVSSSSSLSTCTRPAACHAVLG